MPTLSVRMVNFRDPAVEATDSCAYGFTAVSVSSEYTEWILFGKLYS